MNPTIINDDFKIWDYLITRGYVSTFNDWTDEYQKSAIKIYKNESIDIKNIYRNTDENNVENEDVILCDLAMIAIKFSRDKNLIKSIIEQYTLCEHVGCPNSYSYLYELFKYKHLLSYALNDYKILKKLIDIGILKFGWSTDDHPGHKNSCMLKIIESLKINPFMLDDYHRFLLKTDLLNLDYDNYNTIVDQLKGIVPYPKDVFLASKSKSIKTITVAPNCGFDEDYRQQSQPLFKHNNEIYYGHRDTVYNSIICLNAIKECADFNDLIVLEGTLPYYLVNMYIKSCYGNTLDINKINPSDIIQFIRFIDQYPTTILSIDRLEFEIIEYYKTNKIKYDDYMKDICKRYKLECMCLDIHNKIIDQIILNEDAINTTVLLFNNINKQTGLMGETGIVGETGMVGLVGAAGPGRPIRYYFNCPVTNDRCLVCG